LALPVSVVIVEGTPAPFSRALIAGKDFRSPLGWAIGFKPADQAVADGGGAFLIEGFARRATKTAKNEGD